MAWTCRSCGASNKARARECEGCGREKVATAAKSTLCPMDGTPLDEGFCRVGNGYPGTWACPFACPLCRQPLTWAGACLACYGTPTRRREDWRFGGDRYEYERGHWVRSGGPRPVVAKAISVARMRELVETLAAGVEDGG